MVEKSIEDWCIELGLENFEIEENGIVNVDANVTISARKLYEIPIKFGIVNGFFTCGYNNLKSLEGSPSSVSGNFSCGGNELTSLKYSPIKIYGGYFHCQYNKLKSLKGSPKEIPGSFECFDNWLDSLEGGPNKIGGHFDCSNNPIYKEYKKYHNYQHYMRSVKLKQLI
jgi:hypothetical protein